MQKGLLNDRLRGSTDEATRETNRQRLSCEHSSTVLRRVPQPTTLATVWVRVTRPFFDQNPQRGAKPHGRRAEGSTELLGTVRDGRPLPTTTLRDPAQESHLRASKTPVATQGGFHWR